MSCSERENEAGVDNTQTQKEAELQSFLNDFRSFAKFAVNNPNATEAELTEKLNPTFAKLDQYSKKYELSFPVSEKGEAILLRSQQQNAEGANPVGDYIEFIQATGSEKYQKIILEMVDTGTPLTMSDAQIMADPRMIEAEKVSILCANAVLKEVQRLTPNGKKEEYLETCIDEYNSSIIGCRAILTLGIAAACGSAVPTAGSGAIVATVVATISYQICVDDVESTYKTCVKRANILYG